MISELKKIGSQSLIYGLGIIFIKGIGFFLIPLYTHYLNPTDYGILEIIDLTGYLLGYLVSLEIDQAIFRFYQMYDSKEEKDTVISTAIFFNMIFGLLTVTVMILLSDKISALTFKTPIYSDYFRILFINMYLGALIGLGKSFLRIENKATIYVILSVVQTITAIAFNIYFLVILGIGVKGILYSTLIGTGVINLYFIFFFIYKIKFVVNISLLWKMIRYGLPFVPTGMFSFVIGWSDRYILNYYWTLEVIGVYALGYKMGMILVFLFHAPFNLVWNAYLFDVVKQDNAKDVYSRIATYILIMLVFTGLMISIYSKELIAIMSPNSYHDAFKVVPLIVMSMIFMCSSSVLQVGALVSGKSEYTTISRGIGAVFSVTMNILLIPKYGMIGAGISTATSYFISTIIVLLLSQRVYKIDFEYARFAKIFISAVITFLLFINVINSNIYISILYKVVSIFCFLSILMLFKFFKYNEKAYVVNAIRNCYDRLA